MTVTADLTREIFIDLERGIYRDHPEPLVFPTLMFLVARHDQDRPVKRIVVPVPDEEWTKGAVPRGRTGRLLASFLYAAQRLTDEQNDEGLADWADPGDQLLFFAISGDTLSTDGLPGPGVIDYQLDIPTSQLQEQRNLYACDGKGRCFLSQRDMAGGDDAVTHMVESFWPNPDKLGESIFPSRVGGSIPWSLAQLAALVRRELLRAYPAP